MSPDNEPTFKIGDRVRLNALGRRNSRRPDHRGKIVAGSKSGLAFKIQWDGVKTKYVVHHSFLEPDDRACTSTCADGSGTTGMDTA